MTTVKKKKRQIKRKKRAAPPEGSSEVSRLVRVYFNNIDKDYPKTYINGKRSSHGDNYPTMAKILALCGGEGTGNSSELIDTIIFPLVHHINNRREPEIYDFKPTALFEIIEKEMPKKVALIESLEDVLKSEDKTYTCGVSVNNRKRSDPAFYAKYIQSVKRLESDHYKLTNYKDTVLGIIREQVHLGIFKKPDPIYAFRIIKEEVFAHLNTEQKKEWMANHPHMFFMPSYNAGYIKATLYIAADVLANYINQEIEMMSIIYPKNCYSCTEKQLRNYLYIALDYAVQVFEAAYSFDIHFLNMSQIGKMVENISRSIDLYLEFSEIFKRDMAVRFDTIAKDLYKDHEEMCLHPSIRVSRAKNTTDLLDDDISVFKEALKCHVSIKVLQEKNINGFISAITPYARFEENKLSFKALEAKTKSKEDNKLIKEKLEEYKAIGEKIQNYKLSLTRSTLCSNNDLEITTKSNKPNSSPKPASPNEEHSHHEPSSPKEKHSNHGPTKSASQNEKHSHHEPTKSKEERTNHELTSPKEKHSHHEPVKSNEKHSNQGPTKSASPNKEHSNPEPAKSKIESLLKAMRRRIKFIEKWATRHYP